VKKYVKNTLAIAGLIAPLSPALAQDVTEFSRPAIRDTHSEPPVATSPEEKETRLTKNWGGYRTQLSNRGIDLGLIYKGHVDSLRSGGLKPGTVYSNNMDFRLAMDFEKLLGWPGGSGFFYGLFNHGGEFSSLVGDEQITNNIDAPKDIAKVYEAWVQQTFSEKRISLLAGLHDLNSEFYVTDSSTLFFNSSFGIGHELAQTGSLGPSIFPTTSVCLRIRTEPAESFYFQVGVFNAVASELEKSVQFRFKPSDGALVIGELAYHSPANSDNASPRAFKYALGFWTYSTTSEQLLSSIDASAESQGVSQGTYVMLNQDILERLSVFMRYGVASSSVNPFASNLSAGIVSTGIIPSRDHDRLGLAVTQVRTGSEFRRLNEAEGKSLGNSETTYELSYRFEAIPGLAIQPDFQWVKSPFADPNIEDAKILSARLEVSF